MLRVPRGCGAPVAGLGKSAHIREVFPSRQPNSRLEVTLLVSTTAMKNDSQIDTLTSSFLLEAAEGHE
jgi:hypothetical protein